jgi:hypothetical protein
MGEKFHREKKFSRVGYQKLGAERRKKNNGEVRKKFLHV